MADLFAVLPNPDGVWMVVRNGAVVWRGASREEAEAERTRLIEHQHPPQAAPNAPETEAQHDLREHLWSPREH